MAAVGYRVLGALRHRWVSTLVMSGLVAVVAGAVLTMAAGARRTAGAPDAYTASVGGEPAALVTQDSGRPRTGQIAALPGVSSVEAITFVFAALEPPSGVPVGGVIVFAGSRRGTARLVQGHRADPSDPSQFVADQAFVTRHHAYLGERFRIVSWNQRQADHGLAFNAAPAGPAFGAVLVGVEETPDVLEDVENTVVFSPALLQRDVAIVETLMTVHLEPGFGLGRLRAELDGLPGGRALRLEQGQVVSSEVRNAVDAEGRGLWLIAGVLALAAVIALGQTLSRRTLLTPTERRSLVALGVTRAQTVAETLCRAAVPAGVGIVAGVGVAVLASGLFPPGFVRGLDPAPGLLVDPVVLVLGGLSLFVAILTWVAISALAARPNPVRRTPPFAETLAVRAPGPEAAVGIRFAFTRHDRSATSGLALVAALTLLMVGVVGAATFAVSLDRLVSDPARFGSNYTFGIGDNSDLTAADLRPLGRDRDIGGLTILTLAQLRSGRQTIPLVGVEHVKGDVSPVVLAGRLPLGPDEVALGRVAADQLDAHIGDTVTFHGQAGGGAYHVVGLAVVPGIGANDGVGMGGVVSVEGLQRLQRQPDTTVAAVAMRAGAPPGAAGRVAKALGQAPGHEDTPASILNVARVRVIPALLALLLVALALVTVLHALVVSIGGRRRDLAVLRAMGADRRWVARTVHWQATVLALSSLVIAVPLGRFLGSAVFRAFVDRIGAVPDPTLPLWALAVGTAAVIVVVNVMVIVPVRRAHRLPVARLLQDE